MACPVLSASAARVIVGPLLCARHTGINFHWSVPRHRHSPNIGMLRRHKELRLEPSEFGDSEACPHRGGAAPDERYCSIVQSPLALRTPHSPLTNPPVHSVDTSSDTLTQTTASSPNLSLHERRVTDDSSPPRTLSLLPGCARPTRRSRRRRPRCGALPNRTGAARIRSPRVNML